MTARGTESVGQGAGRRRGRAKHLLDVAAKERARNFRATRDARKTEIAEDYVELIADLIDSGGEARTVDIADRLGVSHATVVKTVARIKALGLVTSRPYRGIFLTERGRAIANASRARHEVILAFLRAIGVSEATAQRDAEGMEHHCSPETLAAFVRVIRSRR
ncbi:MAG TPA: manganese-binding transcriptional regulator MntR [Alphaproteobacteria bacterium]|jgi:DtxR family manganese transport transcriptional regulator|nr:manganese-binding transcriptional regulator MntR [Alphaproteobacteria bacterium]